MTNENNNERHEDEEFEFTIDADFGDLVTVEGYPDQLFIVEGYRCEVSYYPDITMKDTVFELIDAINNDYIEADAIDITFITDAGQADEYLRTIDRKRYPKPGAQWMGGVGGMSIADILNEGAFGMAANKPERKLTPRELSGQEADRRKAARKQKAEDIDNLLEIAFWNREMFEKTGDDSYKDAVIATEAKLAELTKEGE
jgi:hypothetical protein